MVTDRTKEGAVVLFFFFSSFSENYVIAPVGSMLTPGRLHHGLEVNSTEFQWSCWSCLFGFYGETGHQVCNQIGYCYCPFSLSLSLFSLLTLTQSHSVIKLWRIIQLSSTGGQKLACCLLFRRWICFLSPIVNDDGVSRVFTLHQRLPN